MDLRPRYLRANHSCASPGTCIAVDTETRPILSASGRATRQHRFLCGVSIKWRFESARQTRREVLHFTSLAVFWEFVERHLSARRPLWLFAHNLAFDLSILRFWEKIDSGEYWLYNTREPALDLMMPPEQRRPVDGLLVAEDPPTIVIVRHRDGGKLICVDTLNYHRAPLSELGEACGIPKGEFPGSYAPLEQLQPYCERDAEIVEQTVCGLVRWWREGDYGMFRWTAGGLAMAAFRHKFLPYPICVPQSPEHRAWERQGYYGGEIRCFRRGTVDGPIYQLDANSLFAFAMSRTKVPVAHVAHIVPAGGPLADSIERPLAGMAHVQIRSRREAFPVRLAGTVWFCVGEFACHLCGDELDYAATQGYVSHWLEWSTYRTMDLFSEYVEHFYRERLRFRGAGERLYERLCKSMLVCLYGKFGQKSPRWIADRDKVAPAPWSTWQRLNRETGELVDYRSIGRDVERREDRDEHPAAWPAIAAHITSAARQHMRRLRQIAGTENVYYQVTDSLHCNRAGLDRLQAAGWISETELGALRIEGEAESAEYRGCNDLRFGDRDMRGPLKPTAVEIAPGEWAQEEWERLSSLLSRRPDGTVRATVVKKRPQAPRIGGEVRPDGHVLPFSIESPLDCSGSS